MLCVYGEFSDSVVCGSSASCESSGVGVSVDSGDGVTDGDGSSSSSANATEDGISNVNINNRHISFFIVSPLQLADISRDTLPQDSAQPRTNV